MKKIMISPGRYVQGPEVIKDLGREIAGYGKKALVLGGRSGIIAVRDSLEASLADSGIAFQIANFGGECSRQEIDRIAAMAEEDSSDIIVGVGGGKTLDTAKAAALYAKLPVAIVPTIAATDAPCSALAVIYTAEGIFESYLMLPKNPDLVLVDTSIIAKSPVRLLVSGMGDALATWFEADACSKAFAKNMPGGLSTTAALSLANLCYRVLIEYGYQAKKAAEHGVVTEALEKVIEANTLLSGLGFESSGLAAAHAVHNGLTVLEETHQAYHGEKVSFGTLVQMVLENQSMEALEEVINFCRSVGLPVTLKEIGVTDVTEEKIRKVAKATCAEDETIFNEPFTVTPETVYAAIVTADAIGRAF
ncbi:MAG: iron-containing alcohol dehydrogenase [Firmicutes bacterium]|nr:iron-containing alcohol dehydrogenase [Bacillota bacterium]